MELQVRDKVTIIDSSGSAIAEGTIVNINDFREPSLKYAVDVEGYTEDLLFFGENHLIKHNNF